MCALWPACGENNIRGIVTGPRNGKVNIVVVRKSDHKVALV